MSSFSPRRECVVNYCQFALFCCIYSIYGPFEVIYWYWNDKILNTCVNLFLCVKTLISQKGCHISRVQGEMAVGWDCCSKTFPTTKFWMKDLRWILPQTALFIQFKAKWHPLNPAICLQKSHGIICTNDRHPPFLPRAQNSAWTSFILSLTTFIWLFVGRLSISTSLGTNTTDPANPPDHRPSGPRTTDPQDPRPLTHYPRNRPFR